MSKRVIPQSHKDAISKKLKGVPRSKEVIEKIRAGNVRFQEKKRGIQTSIEAFDERFSDAEAKEINDWRFQKIRRAIGVFNIDIGWTGDMVICRKCHKFAKLKDSMTVLYFLEKFEPFIEKHKYCNV